jgi:hypothetical protein
MRQCRLPTHECLNIRWKLLVSNSKLKLTSWTRKMTTGYYNILFSHLKKFIKHLINLLFQESKIHVISTCFFEDTYLASNESPNTDL